ncbi:hypothetical protein B0F90DRAFT_1683786 [Multifurca ochricompacta]|uniref:Ubiquitin-like domain-containing protein n=1 Tax=Multifurca ochricompacta TaxID=376703 RepID=A0AAD4MC78_9AGAM|nr:hypothetical protein B0F90DRAFT_1683786 [Multifurca ochricompacta]
MSLVIRVELPTYSHSLLVSVPSNGTVNDVKREIERVCAGNPRVHGQRLIWRGRFLSDDEKVFDIWKSPNDAPVVHLAVHPSAWTGTPPSVATNSVNPNPVPTAVTSTVLPPPHANANSDSYFLGPQPPLAQYTGQYPRPTPPVASPPPPAALPVPTSVPGLAPISVGYINFIAFQHLNAASVLRYGRTVDDPPPTGLAESRSLAMQLMSQWGYSWPHILDEEYPPLQDESAGIKYIPVTIDGQDYLQLVDPSKTPTPVQSHALRVLEHTFALLAMPVPSASAYMVPPVPQSNTHLPVHINAHLQQIGLPPLRVRQENAMIAELRAVPMRALAAPLVMLTLRTLFLLYFFSPFQKPVFGIIVAAWLLYETWNTIRNAIPRLNARDNHADEDARILGNARVRPAEAARPLVPNVPLRAPPVPLHRAPMHRPRPPSETMVETLATVNLREESNALEARPEAIATPTIGHRIKTFVGLLMLTAHPAVWDRRRTALRQREGRVRTEINERARESPELGEGEGEGNEAHARARADLRAMHSRRPEWVTEYMERVRRGGDWVDDQ